MKKRVEEDDDKGYQQKKKFTNFSSKFGITNELKNNILAPGQPRKPRQPNRLKFEELEAFKYSISTYEIVTNEMCKYNPHTFLIKATGEIKK